MGNDLIYRLELTYEHDEPQIMHYESPTFELGSDVVLYIGKYTARIRVIDRNFGASPLTGGVEFFVDDVHIQYPKQGDSMTLDSSAGIRWTRHTYATAYDVLITGPDPKTWKNSYTVHETKISLSLFLYGGLYKAKVRVVFERSKLGPWSPEVTFTLVEVLIKPIIDRVYVRNDVGPEVKIWWTKVKYAHYYELRIYRVESTITKDLAYKYLIEETPDRDWVSHTARTLEMIGDYVVYVGAVGSAGKERIAWSAPAKFNLLRILNKVLPEERIHFHPVSGAWMDEKSRYLGFPIVKRRQDLKQIDNAMFKDADPPETAKRIQPDGNCFFSSISDLITGSPQYFHEMRKMLCTYVRTNPRLASNNVEKYFTDTNMELNRTYADDIMILAAANILKTFIYVYAQSHPNQAYYWNEFDPNPNNPALNAKEKIYLLNVEVHYEPLYELHYYWPEYVKPYQLIPDPTRGVNPFNDP